MPEPVATSVSMNGIDFETTSNMSAALGVEVAVGVGVGTAVDVGAGVAVGRGGVAVGSGVAVGTGTGVEVTSMVGAAVCVSEPPVHAAVTSATTETTATRVSIFTSYSPYQANVLTNRHVDRGIVWACYKSVVVSRRIVNLWTRYVKRSTRWRQVRVHPRRSGELEHRPGSTIRLGRLLRWA